MLVGPVPKLRAAPSPTARFPPPRVPGENLVPEPGLSA